MEKDFFKSENERYSTTLRLDRYRSDYYHHCYKDVRKAIQLLSQIHALSKTEEGRTQIYNIQPSIIRYHLMQAVNTRWYVRQYWDVDNLSLKILANLVTDPRFFRDAAIAKTDLIRLINRNSGKIFVELCSLVVQNINIAEKKKMLETPLEIYQTQFNSKEEAIAEMSKHKDFYNFSGSSIHFKEEFPLYINMLRGALKAGAKKEVICKFPKDCFGCVIFSMVSGGYRTNQRQLAVTFLSELTNGWITQTFYDIMQSKMKALFRHLKRNEDLQDKYELVCLRFVEYDRSIYNYLQKLSRKDRNGELATSRKILNRDDFEEEIMVLKTQQKLSDQRSQISKNYRKISEASKSFLDISKLVSVEQAHFIKEAVSHEMELQGVKLKKLTLRYAHQESMRRYNLSSMLGCSSHNIFIARNKEGRTFGGYFISHSTYYNLIGKALLFSFDPSLSFKMGDLIESPRIKGKRKQSNNKNKQKVEDVLQEQDEYLRMKYLKMRQQQRYNRINIQDICESQSQSDSQGQATHRLVLRAGSRFFTILIKVKEGEGETIDPWNQFRDTFKLDDQPDKSSLTMDIDHFQFYSLETDKLPK